MPRKAYTVEEANALLPLLERVMGRVDEIRLRAQQHHDRLQVLDLLWGGRLTDAANPDHSEAASHRTALIDCAREIERLVREEILDRGIRFPQGGLEHGLVDFPTLWEGRWVYLCWRRGEPALSAWHEVDGGYAGRRPITAEQARQMGRDGESGDVDEAGLDG